MKYAPWALTAALLCTLSAAAQEPGRDMPPGGFRVLPERAPMGGERAPMGYEQPPMGGERGPMGYERPPMGAERAPMGVEGARTYLDGDRLIVEPGRPCACPDNAPPAPLGEAGWRFAWDNEPANSPFKAGSWAAVAYMSGDFGIFADNAELWGAHYGIGYYYRDNVSFNVEVFGLYGSLLVRRPESDPPIVTPQGILPGEFRGTPRGNEAPIYGIATQALIRCHVLNYGTWSLYGDWGVGFAYLSKSIPSDGTNYDFILTAGVGFTKQLADSVHLIGGCRWFHFSNGAFFTDVNPGYDSKMVYLGLLVNY